MRRRHWLIGIGVAVALFAAVIVLSALLPTDPSRQPDSVTNPRPDGTMALAQVLQSQGVQVRQVTSLDEASRVPARTSLVVVVTQELSDGAIERLRSAAADLVILSSGQIELDTVGALTNDQVTADYWYSDMEHPPASCSDPDAVAAKEISPAMWGLYPWALGPVNACFLDEAGIALYADGHDRDHRFTVIAGSERLHNDTITTFGNAALALRVLGRHPQLTWYLPSADAFSDDSGDARIDAYDLLPPWFGPVSALLGLALVAAAGWRGRRFGPLVAERLPVAAPASEVASGLARLYRQGGAHAHAAAALRAASLHRLGVRLGLPTTATPDLVVERLARAGGVDPQQLRTLYYGPAPDTDSDLVALATQLSDLEAKVTSHE
jgi:hypothetical protein